jgi:hypothetical protein
MVSCVALLAFVMGVADAQSRPPVIQVTVDVKPGDTPTTLEPKREGMVPIAILSTKQFDATQVDTATVRAGAKGTEAALFRSAMEDVNGDRLTDVMLLFRVQEMGLDCSGKSVTLKGKTKDGKEFEGTEKVEMVACK